MVGQKEVLIYTRATAPGAAGARDASSGEEAATSCDFGVIDNTSYDAEPCALG